HPSIHSHASKNPLSCVQESIVMHPSIHSLTSNGSPDLNIPLNIPSKHPIEADNKSMVADERLDAGSSSDVHINYWDLSDAQKRKRIAEEALARRKAAGIAA